MIEFSDLWGCVCVGGGVGVCVGCVCGWGVCVGGSVWGVCVCVCMCSTVAESSNRSKIYGNVLLALLLSKLHDTILQATLSNRETKNATRPLITDERSINVMKNTIQDSHILFQ